ncbi:dynein regulatory complex protein 9-like [Nymphalis io]|uniref:dynein regulatory complex protein 9-like n=1 Tax=Inachis io TaxID=171585 RepID=UPI00216839ED|nr:dynein regulatory complex protein 9-like [Nymphalis io]
MDALLFAINLEVMLLQMEILGYGFRNKRQKQLYDKLVRDRKIAKEVSLRTLVELAEGGDWYTLKQVVNMLETTANSGTSLRAQYDKTKTSLEDITMELQRNRQQWAIDLRNCDIKIAFLRDSIKDSVLNSRFQFDYVDKWLSARAESLELQTQTKITPAPRLEFEDCVHDELLRAFALQIKEREDLLEYWKSRYANDTADIESRLAEQCEKLRDTVKRRGELESLYKLHEGEMRAWLTFKKERGARLAREERLRRAATRIQAWWRGVMVRRALGTFRYLRNVKKTMPKNKKK